MNPLFCEEFRKLYSQFVQSLYKHKSSDTNDNSKKRFSSICLLFKNVYFVGHFMNTLCFIWPFVHTTAEG